MRYQSTKVIDLGSCAFRQPFATSHCRFIHGYRLSAKFWFDAKELDENNWVVDFGDLDDLIVVLRNQFDHTFCIDKKDPRLVDFMKLSGDDVVDLRVMDAVGIEKFAEWCCNKANEIVIQKTNKRCCCTKVEVWEHDKNSAIYEA